MEFFSNYPVIGFIGTAASVLGVILAIIFFVSGREHRELYFYANPARAVIYKAGETSRLSLTLDGEPVERDVSAVQVAIWNEGKKSIKREHVLRPLVIKTSKEYPILEATIRKQTREVVEAKLNLKEMKSGEIKVDWKILEQGDGAVIQLVYFGDTEVPITATSTIEGQPKIKEVEDKTKISKWGMSNLSVVEKITTSLILWALAAFFFIPRLVSKRVSKISSIRFFYYLPVVFAIIIIILGIMIITGFFQTPDPPFGF